MSDFANVAGIIAVMAWLASGGYAFAVLASDGDKLSGEQIGVIFVASLVIAPFMAAWAFVHQRAKS